MMADTSSPSAHTSTCSEGRFKIPIEKTIVIAQQNLAELKNERRIYRAALALVAEFGRGKECDRVSARDCLFEIVEHVSVWPKQWQRERQLRLSVQGYAHQPEWFFGQDNLNELQNVSDCVDSIPPIYGFYPASSPLSDPIQAGHWVICVLVNTFRPVVYYWGNRPVEAPGWDLTGGIRPILYYILRREYLKVRGVGICRNTECRDVFEIERSGQEFCGEECSRRQRQREYWQNRGKKMRKRRLKTRESSSARQLGRTSANKGDLKSPIRK